MSSSTSTLVWHPTDMTKIQQTARTNHSSDRPDLTLLLEHQTDLPLHNRLLPLQQSLHDPTLRIHNLGRHHSSRQLALPPQHLHPPDAQNGRIQQIPKIQENQTLRRLETLSPGRLPGNRPALEPETQIPNHRHLRQTGVAVERDADAALERAAVGRGAVVDERAAVWIVGGPEGRGDPVRVPGVEGDGGEEGGVADGDGWGEESGQSCLGGDEGQEREKVSVESGGCLPYIIYSFGTVFTLRQPFVMTLSSK